MGKDQFTRILRRYNKGTATKEEVELVETYYDLLLARSKSETVLSGNENLEPDMELIDQIWSAIRQGGETRMRSFRGHTVWKAAALIAILIGVGTVLYRMERQDVIAGKTADRSADNKIKQIRPGKNIAVLTLANGKTVFLDSASDGSLAQQGGTHIIKLNNGQLVYKFTATKKDGANKKPVYNTLATPRGGQYELVLPDGTKVWLNAASSLHFPAAFTGDTRTVELKGEGFFDVAPDARKPFVVSVGGVNVHVLGTRFNVNSYEGEGDIRTTLEDGSVSVTGGGKSVILKPGQDAGFNEATGEIRVSTVNVASVIAWKDGLFYFDNTNIREIMDQVSRWYDAEIVYKTTNLDHKSYSGKLPRYSDVDALLKVLEMTGTVHFQVKGHTITVLD